MSVESSIFIGTVLGKDKFIYGLPDENSSDLNLIRFDPMEPENISYLDFDFIETENISYSDKEEYWEGKFGIDGVLTDISMLSIFPGGC